MKCSVGIYNFLEEISSLSHSAVFLFLHFDHWERLSYLSLLFFGTLHSNRYIFPFLLCLLLLFFSQLFVRAYKSLRLLRKIKTSSSFWKHGDRTTGREFLHGHIGLSSGCPTGRPWLHLDSPSGLSPREAGLGVPSLFQVGAALPIPPCHTLLLIPPGETQGWGRPQPRHEGQGPSVLSGALQPSPHL